MPLMLYPRCLCQSMDASGCPPLLQHSDSDSGSGWDVSGPQTPTYPESRPNDSDAAADSAELLSLAWLPPRQQVR